MSNYKYSFSEVDFNSLFTADTYSDADNNLINDFEINSSFNKDIDFIELHYYTLDGRWLKEVPRYTNFSTAPDSGTANQGTLDSIVLKSEADLAVGGYEAGEVYLTYNFLNDPFTSTSDSIKFFIEEISQDRTELRLLTTELDTEKTLLGVENLKREINNTDSSDFILNFGKNRLLLGINVDTLPYKEFTSVVVKLYNPLPVDLSKKDTLKINLKKADTVTFLSTADLIVEEKRKQYIKGPNFNLNQQDSTSNPTEYLSLNQAFSYPVTNSYYEVRSIFDERGAELSIDYSDYSNFINFSSAQERLENFKYKFDLISTYQSASNARLNYTNSLQVYSGSKEYYEGLINSILSNFDHYDRYLYYETGSYSWPKSGLKKPYTLLTGAATGSWYTQQLVSASNYDAENPNQLINTVPEYLREDPNNARYKTFINMVGQHFDNLWLYSKAVTDKYNADNRLSEGISKDLIEDALRNFGVKLYSSNKSTQELFKMFTGETELSGSNTITREFGIIANSGSFEVISGSNSVTSEENYRKQIYKRVYHNLPLLLKSKGTERGLRALMSSFGVPSLYSEGVTGSLFITQYGGTISGSYNLGEYQYITSSIDRIRIDNTGSFLSSSDELVSNVNSTVLSQYVSINKRDKKYANDINQVEVGFSPTNNINSIITSASAANNFNIDSIIGDPGYAYSGSYDLLQTTAKTYLSEVTSKYNLKDFIRLLKYYDNVLFKTIKDFVPARSNINTGVVIKPHLLERSKIKQVRGSFERHNEFTASINIASSSGHSGFTFGRNDSYTTSYTGTTMTPNGTGSVSYYLHEEPKFNGELSGSYLKLTNGELNITNSFKQFTSSIANFSRTDYDVLVNNAKYVQGVPYIYDVDRQSGIVPVNYTLISKSLATTASFQEYLHNNVGLSNARYNGSTTDVFDYGTVPSIGLISFKGVLFGADVEDSFICSQSLADLNIRELGFTIDRPGRAYNPIIYPPTQDYPNVITSSRAASNADFKVPVAEGAGLQSTDTFYQNVLPFLGRPTAEPGNILVVRGTLNTTGSGDTEDFIELENVERNLFGFLNLTFKRGLLGESRTVIQDTINNELYFFKVKSDTVYEINGNKINKVGRKKLYIPDTGEVFLITPSGRLIRKLITCAI